ncbi:BON domain-containing protein [Rhizobium sp. ZK1]|uniref:BON domain-containing protein n=2 Tax=unclassified Rhizobium TaxID=2613769 RepID=UPI0039F662AB
MMRKRTDTPVGERHLQLVHSRPANAADLESEVSASLHRAGDIDATYIFVSAHDGGVTLAGWVPLYTQIERAADVAWGVGGVRHVLNELSCSL